ncbi:PEP-CTERM sorting domain-containing protein [bacterium]|nr:MAG: PEP-CTERM sorting domain-containing protein [bacterium]
MRLLRTSTALGLAGALVVAAQAGQTFSFASPITASDQTYSNSVFETQNFGAFGTSMNLYTGTVNLITTNFNEFGVQTGSPTTTSNVRYFLSNDPSTPDQNSSFGGGVAPNDPYGQGEGVVTFYENYDDSPGAINDPVLRITFSASLLGQDSNGRITDFRANEGLPAVVTFSGSLVDLSNPADLSNPNFAFSFFSDLSDGGNPPAIHSLALFNSSIGQVEAVPEPSTMAALALGGLAVLRRRRKA